MRMLLGMLVCLVAAGCATAPENSNVRLKFVPGSEADNPGQWSGTSWSSLGKGIFTDDQHLGLHARAVIGGKFPVQMEDGPLLFEVMLKDGNDDRITIDVLGPNPSITLVLNRDESVETTINGIVYTFRYPSLWVGPDDGETTPVAHLFLRTPLV
jgi:hypothetical protein